MRRIRGIMMMNPHLNPHPINLINPITPITHHRPDDVTLLRHDASAYPHRLVVVSYSYLLLA